jgi:hypothetical protein
MDAKPSRGHVWTPTKNDVFQYQETITPNTQALEIENFQFQRTIKDLAKSLRRLRPKLTIVTAFQQRIFVGNMTHVRQFW